MSDNTTGSEDEGKPIADEQQKKHGSKKAAYDIEKTPFSWDKLDGLLAIKSTLVMCAELLDVSHQTIKNHIRARFDQTFTEYQERKLSKTKVRLIQQALTMAMNGDRTMLIFCLKNICKWSDEPEKEAEDMITRIKVDGKKEAS